MRFAAIADIHGNSDALEAVLADIAAQGLSDIVNLGDVASGPLEARRTIELLMPCHMVTVRGNHDRYLTDLTLAEMGSWERDVHAQLDPLHLDWLRALPASCVFRDRVYLCHAAPANDNLYWLETVHADGTLSMASRAVIEALAEGIDHPLILCGHSHLPRAIKLSDGRMIVNPGSVGCPGYRDVAPVPHVVETGTPDACYAILDDSDGRWQVTFRHVPYASARMVALARQNNRPAWASALETGWVK
jgi:diadenosine tetraphosphatase ApaH/serine/threonine PP2A family protein phosphatase